MSARPQPEVEGVRHREVAANGVRLHVAEAGEGNPLVLLHGWPQHWWMWRELIGPLAADGNRVLCPDLRGFGWSEAPPSGYDKDTLARDVLALLDALGLERVRVVGHDWGGWVGYLLCALEPDRVERFVGLSIPPPFADSTVAGLLNGWRFAYQGAISTPFVGERLVGALGGAGGPILHFLGATPPAWDEQAALVYLEQFAEPERARASVQLYRTFLVRELPAQARGRWREHRHTVPTLALSGDREPVVRPELFRGYERRADDMRFEVLEGLGHFVVDEAPELILERVRAFLA